LIDVTAKVDAEGVCAVGALVIQPAAAAMPMNPRALLIAISVALLS